MRNSISAVVAVAGALVAMGLAASPASADASCSRITSSNSFQALCSSTNGVHFYYQARVDCTNGGSYYGEIRHSLRDKNWSTATCPWPAERTGNGIDTWV